jgi:pimeloyl-ACP methyl ester carboxylesterase
VERSANGGAMGSRSVSGPVRFVRIGGRQLEVEHIRARHPHDRAGRDTIVLLHEALGSVSHWRDFPQQLAERCGRDVLVYSRLGHGRSEGPPARRSRQYFEQQSLEILPALLDHFHVEHPVLLGHSEGAAIALIYSAQHQTAPSAKQVQALILESPILLLEPSAASGMALAERAYRETDLRDRLARHHDDADAVFAAWLSIRESDSLLHTPLEAHLPRIETPVLMLQGERDEYATMLQAEALRPIAPHLQLLRLPESGHTPHREQPEIVLERIAAFLSSLPAPASNSVSV